MTKLKVTEVFYSLQGEGARAGEPSVFVRLADCNLTCGFCDTEFASGVEMTCSEVIEAAFKAVRKALPDTWGGVLGTPCSHWVVWTGGEPTLQLTEEHVKFFEVAGWKQAIETNGTNPVPRGIDWVACSPKVAEHVLAKSFPSGVDELRYVRHAGQPGVPKPAVKARRLFLSPMFDGDKPSRENTAHCVRLCLENPEWSLSLQLHKLLRVL